MSSGDAMEEFRSALQEAKDRLLRFDAAQYGQDRAVGRAHLPTTVAGLLIHIAEHTQRHVGQAITTAKVIAAGRTEADDCLA